MKNIKYYMLSLFLGITLTNAQSVGIKNTLEDPNIPTTFLLLQLH